jgi:hypothetical protein
MTRLPSDGGARPPLRRLALGGDDGLVLELDERGVTIRPKRSRAAAARVRIAWGAIYVHAILAREADRPRARRRR